VEYFTLFELLDGSQQQSSGAHASQQNKNNLRLKSAEK